MDGIETGWAIPLFLIGFVIAWQAYFTIAYYDGDLHPDVLETWTLGRSFEWGSSKHPPLMGWVARAWTSVFPLSNWSFQLLALTNSAIALWIVDLISRHFARGDKRVIVLLLLTLLPTYQFFAQKFNANAVLLATWPLATYCFLRSFETLEFRWAIAAGATAGLAMLGKYYSVFLLLSFGFAAVLHPQRRHYFFSLAPWISMLVGFVILAPHLYWLLTTGAKPCAYALEKHAGKAFGPSILEAFLFVLGIGMVMLLAAAAWVWMARDRLRSFAEDFQAMNYGMRLLFLISIGTIVFPAITSIALGTDMPPTWALQGLFMFAVLVVCGASYTIERVHSVNLATVVICISLLAVVVVAPVHALYRNDHPLHEGRNFYRLAAEELTRQWHAQSDVAVPAVGGDDDLALAVAFYSPDHPVYTKRLVYPSARQPLDQATFDRGWVALCFGEDAHCVAAMEKIAARALRFVKSEFVVQSTLLGRPGATARFEALIVPPFEPKIAPPRMAENFNAVRRDRSAPYP